MFRSFACLIVLMLFVLAACDDAEVAKKQPPKAKAQTSQKKVAADKGDEAREESVIPVYAYNPYGKRDPFASPLSAFEGGAIEALTPLQRYDVGQFRLSGVVLGLSIPKAMVKSPDGKNYILQVGTKIGKNGGVVVKINNEGVLVEEILRDFSGETRVNSVLIALPQKKGV